MLKRCLVAIFTALNKRKLLVTLLLVLMVSIAMNFAFYDVIKSQATPVMNCNYGEFRLALQHGGIIDQDLWEETIVPNWGQEPDGIIVRTTYSVHEQKLWRHIWHRIGRSVDPWPNLSARDNTIFTVVRENEISVAEINQSMALNGAFSTWSEPITLQISNDFDTPHPESGRDDPEAAIVDWDKPLRYSREICMIPYKLSDDGETKVVLNDQAFVLQGVGAHYSRPPGRPGFSEPAISVKPEETVNAEAPFLSNSNIFPLRLCVRMY